MLEFLFDSTRAVADMVFTRVLQRYPRIRWIVTRCGGALPLLADRTDLFRKASDSGAHNGATVQEHRRLWFDMAGTPFPHQVPALVRAFGSDRLLYRSDYCWTLAAAQIASVDAAEQPGGTTWRRITDKNAAKLLPGLRPRLTNKGSRRRSACSAVSRGPAAGDG
jgi:predicted TIM-barrel fold metal-dependent hydrolase